MPSAQSVEYFDIASSVAGQPQAVDQPQAADVAAGGGTAPVDQPQAVAPAAGGGPPAQVASTSAGSSCYSWLLQDADSSSIVQSFVDVHSFDLVEPVSREEMERGLRYEKERIYELLAAGKAPAEKERLYEHFVAAGGGGGGGQLPPLSDQEKERLREMFAIGRAVDPVFANKTRPPKVHPEAWARLQRKDTATAPVDQPQAVAPATGDQIDSTGQLRRDSKKASTLLPSKPQACAVFATPESLTLS